MPLAWWPRIAATQPASPRWIHDARAGISARAAGITASLALLLLRFLAILKRPLKRV